MKTIYCIKTQYMIQPKFRHGKCGFGWTLLRLSPLNGYQLRNGRLVLIHPQETVMRILQSIRTCVICLPLVVAMTACGGGGGDPGANPNLDNSPTTKLHPQAYVERWWPECTEAATCPKAPAR